MQTGVRRFGPKKLAVLAVIVASAITTYLVLGRYLSLEQLAEQEAGLRQLQSQFPVLVFAAAFVIYVSVTGLSLPGATVLTLLYAWYFGFWPALGLVSCASTGGATLAFLSSRYLFRDWFQQKFGERLAVFNQALQREGAYYLFTLRLIPAVPFFVINVVMGLTQIRIGTFWWVSQLGMFPGTCVYVYAGTVVPDLQTLADAGAAAVISPSRLTQIFIALALLGAFPLLIKWMVTFVKRAKKDSVTA